MWLLVVMFGQFRHGRDFAYGVAVGGSSTTKTRLKHGLTTSQPSVGVNKSSGHSSTCCFIYVLGHTTTY